MVFSIGLSLDSPEETGLLSTCCHHEGPQLCLSRSFHTHKSPELVNALQEAGPPHVGCLSPSYPPHPRGDVLAEAPDEITRTLESLMGAPPALGRAAMGAGSVPWNTRNPCRLNAFFFFFLKTTLFLHKLIFFPDGEALLKDYRDTGQGSFLPALAHSALTQSSCQRSFCRSDSDRKSVV